MCVTCIRRPNWSTGRNDTPGTVERGWLLTKSKPALLDYYQAANVLFVVDGTREPEAIFKEIEEAVKSEK